MKQSVCDFCGRTIDGISWIVKKAETPSLYSFTQSPFPQVPIPEYDLCEDCRVTLKDRRNDSRKPD